MTEKKWIYMMVGIPLAIALIVSGILVFLAGFEIALKMGMGLALGVVLVFGFARVIMWLSTRHEYGAFEQLARERNGNVISNVMGEKQLRLSDDGQTVLVDCRVTGEGSRPKKKWLRIALRVPACGLESATWRLDRNGNLAGTNLSPGAEGAVRDLFIPGLPEIEVKIEKQEKGGELSIWLPAGLNRAGDMAKAIDLFVPKLRNLATACEQ